MQDWHCTAQELPLPKTPQVWHKQLQITIVFPFIPMLEVSQAVPQCVKSYDSALMKTAHFDLCVANKHSMVDMTWRVSL